MAASPSRKRIFLTLGGIVVLGLIGWSMFHRQNTLVLTGIVTTDDVIVSPMVSGQIGQLLVDQGDSVRQNQLVARLIPAELQADVSYYTHSADEGAVRVAQNEVDLRYQQSHTAEQVHQAQAMLDNAVAQQTEARANLANAKLTRDRYQSLLGGGAISQQDWDQARTQYDVAKARADAADNQVDAQRAALALANAEGDQVAITRHALSAAQQEQAAAAAQRTKADVRLSYTELRAPISGIVDVRAVRQGEVVTAGQPVITLVNPDSLWVRADLEESYIDRIRLGDTLTIRLPSGETRQGVVFYRGVDADFATQRDVSRSKRDIKTFEIRLHVDNHDRRLAMGMTAYVLVPLHRA